MKYSFTLNYSPAKDTFEYKVLTVIVDDVDAELDGTALARLVDHLGNERQVFLSSTNDGVATLVGVRSRRMRLDNGAVVHQEAKAHG